jgi:hypothetical protein
MRLYLNMNKIYTISGFQYILHKNIGWCKCCQTYYESEYKIVTVECACKGCLVSGGISSLAKVYGPTALNASIWKNMETGELIRNTDLLLISRQSNS